MTIIVLGIDAFEFDLVEEFRLKCMQQEACCRLSLLDFKVVVTPPIWASMITGVVLEEMVNQFIPIFHSNQGLLAHIKGMIPWKIRRTLGKKLNPLQRVLEGSRNPMKETSDYVNRNKIPTIFDEFKSWYSSIPGYNLDSSLDLEKDARNGTQLNADLFENNKAKQQWLKRCNASFERDVENLFCALSRKTEYDLIFWYTAWLDHVGHLEHGHKLKTMNRYLRVNSIVGDLQRRLCDRDILYIISDHGMMPAGGFGLHSNHGFFSSSTGEIIQKPQELYTLLKRNLEVSQKS